MALRQRNSFEWLHHKKEPSRSSNKYDGQLIFHTKIEEELIEHYENNKPKTLEDF